MAGMSMDQLAAGIAKSKRVINKVESKDFKPVLKEQLGEDYYEEQAKTKLMTELPQGNERIVPKVIQNKNLNNSKMPKEILESFMKKPAIDTSLKSGVDSLSDKVKELIPSVNRKPIREAREMHSFQESAPQQSGSMDLAMVDHIIRTTFELVLEQLSKKTDINEDFQIKIAGKTFNGKLTTLNETKKK